MTYTTQQLQSMSFYEINKALASKYLQCEYQFNDDLLTVELIETETHLGCHGIPYENIVEYGEFDYMNPNDIMPLAFERKIALIPLGKSWIATTDACSYMNDTAKDFELKGALIYCEQSGNIYRAIACLLLMMDE